MTNIDLILLVIMLGFILWGVFKGLIWTLVRLASYIGAFLLISASGEEVRDFIVDLIKVSPLIGLVISYIAIFIFMIIFGQLIYLLLARLTASLHLGCLNRASGGIFWGATYILILSFIVILFDISPLSLNGRGIRSTEKSFDFDLISMQIEDMLSRKSADIPDINEDLVKEALEKASDRFSDAEGAEEQKQVIQDLYKSMSANLEENNFNEIVENIDIFDTSSLKLKDKNVKVESLMLELVIEPAADFLEEEILKLK